MAPPTRYGCGRFTSPTATSLSWPEPFPHPAPAHQAAAKTQPLARTTVTIRGSGDHRRGGQRDDRVAGATDHRGWRAGDRSDAAPRILARFRVVVAAR